MDRMSVSILMTWVLSAIGVADPAAPDASRAVAAQHAIEAADHYVEIVLITMTGDRAGQLRIPPNLDMANKHFKALGVTPAPVPPEPRQASLAQKSEAAIRYLLSDEKNTIARQIEARWGVECRRLYHWGIVLSIGDAVYQRRVSVTTARLQGLVKTYGESAGLPRELGAPILDELAKPQPNLVRPLSYARNRADFYATWVLRGAHDVAVLSDPEFDRKLPGLKAQAQAAGQRKFLTEYLKGKSPEDETMVLLEVLTDLSGGDEHDVLGQWLREMGPRAVPTLCRVQDRKAPADPNGKYAFAAGRALDMIVYQQAARDVWKGSVPAEAAGRWDGTALLPLVACLQDEATSPAATRMLTRLCSETGGKPVAALQALRKERTDPGSTAAIDAGLRVVADWYADRVVRTVGSAAARGEPAASPEHAKDLEALRALGGDGLQALKAIAARFEEVEEDDAVGRGVRSYLEGAGALKPLSKDARARRAARIAAADRIDATQAAALWAEAVKKVDLKSPRYAVFLTGVTNADVKIGQLEQMLGNRVTRTYEIQGVEGLLDVAMKEDALAAGRFAEQIAIRSDLEKLLAARRAALDLCRSQLDAEVWSGLGFEERHALIRHGFLKKENPFRDILPKAAGAR
jgi:hypothetical protein